MMHKKLLVLSLAVLLFAAAIIWAVPVNAGSWATTGITEMPDQIQAGRPFTLEFMVWQHGNKPVRQLNWGADGTIAVTPQVTFTSVDSAETVTFVAQPGKQKGLFVAEVTLPTAGIWEWSISPDPLAAVTELDPLTILPPPNIPAKNSFQSANVFLAGTGFPAWAALGAALLLGGLLLVVQSRRTRKAG